MSDFISMNEDYIDFIKTEEDMKKFKRLKELEIELEKPVKDCIDAMIEYDNIANDLQGLPRRKWLKMGDPKLN